MWSAAVDPDKVSLEEAEAIAEQMTLGGYSDWRVPTIKELYSLIDFQGTTGSGHQARVQSLGTAGAKQGGPLAA
jgi:hypothetical protein